MRYARSFSLLRLAFVFTVADLTHAVTLIGTGVASLSVTPDMVALDKILDLWCNNQRQPTFHIRLTLGSTHNDPGSPANWHSVVACSWHDFHHTRGDISRCFTNAISTKINTTTLDIRLVARLGVRSCKRDAHDSHCARNACD